MKTPKRKYQITRAMCNRIIKKNGGVCERCGRVPVPTKTVDNAGNPTYWGACHHGDKSKNSWGHFTWGNTPKEIYKLAYKLVLEDGIGFSIIGEEGGSFKYNFQEAVARNVRSLMDIEYIKNNKPRKTKAQLRKEYKKYYKMK